MNNEFNPIVVIIDSGMSSIKDKENSNDIFINYLDGNFEFYRRLLITWFLLSGSVSLVRPQTRIKYGFFKGIARKY